MNLLYIEHVKSEKDAINYYKQIINSLLRNRLIRETIKYKRYRLQRHEDRLGTHELIEELLCINAPMLPETIVKIKNLLLNNATIVLFRNEPFILYHGN